MRVLSGATNSRNQVNSILEVLPTPRGARAAFEKVVFVLRGKMASLSRCSKCCSQQCKSRTITTKYALFLVLPLKATRTLWRETSRGVRLGARTKFTAFHKIADIEDTAISSRSIVNLRNVSLITRNIIVKFVHRDIEWLHRNLPRSCFSFHDLSRTHDQDLLTSRKKKMRCTHAFHPSLYGFIELDFFFLSILSSLSLVSCTS